ncbi:MAG: hypothetical protein NTV22_09750 [bacterium]|nr:hypothetical protein [bacterium]
MTDDQRDELAAGLDAIAAADRAVRFLEVYSAAFNVAVMTLGDDDRADAVAQLQAAGRAAGMSADVVAREIQDGLHDGRAACQPAQRAMIAEKLANMPLYGDGSNQHKEGSANLQNPPISQTAAANLLKVSPRSVASRAGRREIIRQVLADHPNWSSRRLARECGVCGRTIAKYRTDCGLPHLMLEGLDGRKRSARRQPPEGA